MAERARRSVGATLAAARSALRHGLAGNLAGGTHHAYAGKGSGFCVFNDVAVAARCMQAGFRQLLSNPVAQQAVLGHGKAVPLGQRQHKFIGVIGVHDAIVATWVFPGGLPLICCTATKNTCNHTIAA